MVELFWIVVIATSIWVLVDAQTIGVKKGQVKGLADLGPGGWFLACLLLWRVSFPIYLAKRPEFKRLNAVNNDEANERSASDRFVTKSGRVFTRNK